MAQEVDQSFNWDISGLFLGFPSPLCQSVLCSPNCSDTVMCLNVYDRVKRLNLDEEVLYEYVCVNVDCCVKAL